MKVTIKLNLKYRTRLQIFIPERAKFWHDQVTLIKHLYFHSKGHYSMIYGPWAIPQLKRLYGDSLSIDFDPTQSPPITFEKEKYQPRKKKASRPRYQEAVDALEQWIILRQYSYATLKSYRSYFAKFLLYYNDIDPKEITKAQITSYIHLLVKEKNISESAQNLIINAIKCYYEKVLNQPRTVYQLIRPKKRHSLPQVLTMPEVKRILEAVPNLKHRTLLMAIYSGGLRLGEVLRLRVEDLMMDHKKIFIKGGKNKKDRYTLLSQQFVGILEQYIKTYEPQYWLFEGQSGGQYSASSVQLIFRKAAGKANVGAFATLHTLRHSFATHLLEQGVDIRYIQELLGHKNIETTVIYTHVCQNRLKGIISPLDNIDLKSMYT